jgi:hypothetical protein
VPVKEYLENEREKVLEGRIDRVLKVMYNESFELSKRWGKWFKEFWDLPDKFKFELDVEA